MPDTKTLAYAPGYTLPNGAIIVAMRPAGPPRALEESLVLCVIPDNPVTPWVVWTLYPATATTVQGDYFEEFAEAVTAFNFR